MAKKVIGEIRLQLSAGSANPAPPVGTALGPHGVNIMGFCKEFNERTKEEQGVVFPVVISVFKDKSFSFILKQPPVPIALKKAAGLAKAANSPGRETIAKVTMDDVKAIASNKMQDMNTTDLDAAMRVVIGTARSMGIEVVAS